MYYNVPVYDPYKVYRYEIQCRKPSFVNWLRKFFRYQFLLFKMKSLQIKKLAILV